jgi:hypothetical protein
MAHWMRHGEEPSLGAVGYARWGQEIQQDIETHRGQHGGGTDHHPAIEALWIVRGHSQCEAHTGEQSKNGRHKTARSGQAYTEQAPGHGHQEQEHDQQTKRAQNRRRHATRSSFLHE